RLDQVAAALDRRPTLGRAACRRRNPGRSRNPEPDDHQAGRQQRSQRHRASPFLSRGTAATAHRFASARNRVQRPGMLPARLAVPSDRSATAAMTNAAAKAPAQAPGRSLIVLLGSLVMVGPLAIDMYLPSLPDIAVDLAVHPAEVQQTITAFLLGF